MSEEKEICPKCGSVDFAILRDMTSRRVCKCSHSWDAPEKNNFKELSKGLLSTVMDGFRKAEESALIEEILRLSKEGHLHLVSLMPYIENEFENKLTIKSALRLETPKYNQLKYDYDALKKDLEIVRDSHKRQCQLNDTLTAKLEKAESVLKYYADRTNYTLDDDFGVSGEMRRRVILYGDQEEFNEFSSAAGRRAREYLKGEG